ncbi:hypothetical protein KY284_000910 [Solanum tuberosum]|nr:hypothetical protein KY284_000910 [Solanum tuberosum]
MYSTSPPTKEGIQSHKIPRFEGENDFTSCTSPVYLFGVLQRQYLSRLRLLKSSELRKQGYHVATPRFGLGFNLSKPLQISSEKGKGITSSHHTSIEKTRESKEDWVARMKENPLNKWTDMPPPQRPLYFITWELKRSHYQKRGCWSMKIKIFVM